MNQEKTVNANEAEKLKDAGFEPGLTEEEQAKITQTVEGKISDDDLEHIAGGGIMQCPRPKPFSGD